MTGWSALFNLSQTALVNPNLWITCSVYLLVALVLASVVKLSREFAPQAITAWPAPGTHFGHGDGGKVCVSDGAGVRTCCQNVVSDTHRSRIVASYPSWPPDGVRDSF